MVYGVFGGEYSDWWVLGYFDDKEKADAFCKRANENAVNSLKEIYVRELPNLESEKTEEKICVMVDTEDWRVEPGYEDEDFIIDYEDGTALIHMMIYPSQYDRAAKIAQDRWAQYKAEKEGIV